MAAENILRDRSVLAVAGTHGKTTTASILSWILQATQKHRSPGFLIGGKPGNFERSAQLGNSEYFVVEADEYDTAFFDKRSKFVHYHPQIAILNNLEFDHADIFDNLEAIKVQFHHLVRTIPENGTLIINADEPNLIDVINMGCWTPTVYFSTETADAEWFARELDPGCSRFEIHHKQEVAQINWPGMGRHNMRNALAAVAAACQTGIQFAHACSALTNFRFPAKRLQQHRTRREFTLYEDFAHHPTAVHHTVETLRSAYPDQRLIALLELRSNTMQMGVHQQTLGPALAHANIACVVNCTGHNEPLPDGQHPDLHQFNRTADCLTYIETLLKPDDVLVVMSNGHFDGLVKRLCHL